MIRNLIPLSATYDLSGSSSYRVSTPGTFQTLGLSAGRVATADADETTRYSVDAATMVEFESEAVTLTVDMAQAKREEMLYEDLEKRVVVSSYSGSKLSALTTGLQRTSKILLQRRTRKLPAAVSNNVTSVRGLVN